MSSYLVTSPLLKHTMSCVEQKTRRTAPNVKFFMVPVLTNVPLKFGGSTGTQDNFDDPVSQLEDRQSCTCTEFGL